MNVGLAVRLLTTRADSDPDFESFGADFLDAGRYEKVCRNYCGAPVGIKYKKGLRIDAMWSFIC